MNKCVAIGGRADKVGGESNGTALDINFIEMA